MPITIAAKAGIIALSVAVTAAIVFYESPEVRRRADELRRRIAVALHAWGDSMSPNGRQGQSDADGPLFNRPEDAEGFMMTRHGSRGAPDDIDADEASRRRQREELMYWNRLHMEKLKEQERCEADEAIAAVQRATQEAAAAAGLNTDNFPMTNFDQLLHEDGSDEKGSFVVKTGTDYGNGFGSEDPLNGGLVRRRRPEGARGLHASMYTDPFSDEHDIDAEDQHQAVAQLPSSMHASTLTEGAYIGPDADELLSDIYNATEPDTTQNAKIAAVLEAPMASVASIPASDVFFDATAQSSETIAAAPTTMTSSSEPTLLERALADNEFMTASQERAAAETEAEADTYNSIQAWAHMSSHANSFYSPLPVSPVTAPSEPEIVSTGELTPTDSLSMVDGEETMGASTHTLPAAASTVLVHEAASPGSATEGRYYDVISDSEDGDLMTPTSWTEVGSVQSESDVGETVRGRRA